MELIIRTYAQLNWQARTYKHVLKQVRFATIAGPAAIVLAQFAQALSLFLPLKVVIMLNSDGVPRILEFAMTFASRTSWLVALSLATLVLYGLSVFLVTWANRSISKGADALVKAQGSRRLSKQQKKLLKNHYRTLCQSYADAAVAAMGGIAIAFLNWFVFLGVTLALFLQVVLIGWLMTRSYESLLGWLRAAIERNYDNFLRYLGALNFFVVFVLLILDHFITQEIGMLSGLMTLIIARLSFNNLVKFAKKAVPMEKDRIEIDDILFDYPGESMKR